MMKRKSHARIPFEITRFEDKNQEMILRWIFFLGILALAFSRSIAGLSNSWLGFIPMLFFFLSFVVSLLNWGALFEKRFGGGWAGIFLYSSAFACTVSFGLGSLGLLGEKYRILFFLFLGLGFFLSKMEFKRAEIFSAPKGIYFILFFVLGIRFFASFQPLAHGDPLLYHLTGPRLWMQMGAIRLHENLPNAILASSWEYLYLWPQEIFSGAKIESLVAAQIFSQWIHVFFGWFGAAILVERILRDSVREDLVRSCAVLAAMFMSPIQWTAGLAKNDMGIAFWSLGAYFFLKLALEKKRNYFYLFSGLFAGLAISGKINAILFLAPMYVIVFPRFCFALEGSFKKIAFSIGAVAIGFFSGILPIYLRNFLQTGSPFFPMFASFFPSPWISKSWEDHFNPVQPKEVSSILESLRIRLSELGRSSWATYGISSFFFCAFPSKFHKEMGMLWEILAIIITSFVLFALGFPLDAEFRYLSASLLLAGAVGAVGLLKWRIFLPEKFSKLFIIVFLIGILASSKLPTHLLWKFKNLPVGEALLKEHTAGDSKAWLRTHAKPNELIVMLGDNEAYYLSMLNVTVLTERPDIDAATYHIAEFPSFLRGLCKTSKAQYLLDARSGLSERFPSFSFEQALLFKGVSSAVYDLDKLQKIVSNASLGCERERGN